MEEVKRLIREGLARVTVLEGRMGINKDNLPTSNGILEENKKIKLQVNGLEDRLDKIERWETATNYVVNKLNDNIKLILRFIIGFSLYTIFRDLGSTELLKHFADIIKKFIF